MDLEIEETGNGGDYVKNPKDISIIGGFQNMVFLGLFGGNVEASTPNERLQGEQDFSWWGNSVLFKDNPDIQFNSITERRLIEVACNSAGRVKIEEGVKKDLAFMKAFAEVKVAVSIVSDDRLAIGIKLTRLDNLQEREFIYIWDATNLELISKDSVTKFPKGSSLIPSFDYKFDFDFF